MCGANELCYVPSIRPRHVCPSAIKSDLLATPSPSTRRRDQPAESIPRVLEGPSLRPSSCISHDAGLRNSSLGSVALPLHLPAVHHELGGSISSLRPDQACSHYSCHLKMKMRTASRLLGVRPIPCCTSSSRSPAEDQQRINTFSKLNNRLSDLQDQLKAKQVSRVQISPRRHSS